MMGTSNLRSRDCAVGNNSDTSSLDVESQASAENVTFLKPANNGANADGPAPVANASPAAVSTSSAASGISKTGLQVLVLLAFQNCTKNLLLRFVMKDKPEFLTSAAVIGVELVKLVLSTMYILVVDRKPLSSCVTYMKEDSRNTMLMAVPAAAYSLQMTLEYIALSNIDAALFSVLVQTKLLATAGCAVLLLGKKIKKVQFISLMLLTVGVMLCNMKDYGSKPEESLESDGAMENEEVGGGLIAGILAADAQTKGILATLGIAASSGFASVYTEKVIKAQRPASSKLKKEDYGLAYTQVQLAVVSLVLMGLFCVFTEMEVILEKGLWYGFNGPAFFSIFVSALGGLTVAAVLKFADAVLKGYATAISVILTGVMSMILFDTHLNIIYFLGIGNVVCAVLLYSGKNLDQNIC